jgi:hypothetical protein
VRPMSWASVEALAAGTRFSVEPSRGALSLKRSLVPLEATQLGKVPLEGHCSGFSARLSNSANPVQ